MRQNRKHQQTKHRNDIDTNKTKTIVSELVVEFSLMNGDAKLMTFRFHQASNSSSYTQAKHEQKVRIRWWRSSIETCAHKWNEEEEKATCVVYGDVGRAFV